MIRAAAAAAVVLLAAGCGGASGAGSGAGTTPSGLDGRTLFVQQCGACHSLADAGTKGSYGADLEHSGASEAQILRVIADGKGTMPAHIVGGQDAQAVAAYLARVVKR